MKNKKEVLDAFKLVGISVRTNNKKAQTENDIANLWECFFVNDIISKIENKVSDDIYCIYMDYTSDFTEDYTTFIGCVAAQIENIPEGLSAVEIPQGSYYRFVSEGVLPICVLNTWNHIWNTNYDRAYKADFDVYGMDAKDPQNAKVTTYLSII